MNYENLPVAKIVTKLEKTKNSIRAQKNRGYVTLNVQRNLDLLDRYQELREILREKDFQAWKAYCAQGGDDDHHDGYDLFA
jgi:DNA repair ATPase RecN